MPETATADQHNHHDHGHHGFDFAYEMAHHNLPYPAIQPFHGLTVLILDNGKYSLKNYDELSHDPAFDVAEPSPAQIGWAAELVAQGKATEDVTGTELAKAMVVASDHSLLGALPKSLSWINQQIFWGSSALLLVAFLLCVVAKRRPTDLKPTSRFQHVIEAVVLFVRDDICRPNIHHHADSWVPHFSAIFFAVLGMNVFGLIPGTGTATGNPGVTAGLALTTLIGMLMCGMKEQGGLAFWKNLVPVHWSWKPMDMVIYIILAIIEVMGLIIKPAALAIRLFANMFGGHTVLLAFITLGFILQAAATGALLTLGLGAFGLFIAVPIYLLELLVAFLQAYVFTLLSAVFIGAAMNPEH